MHLYMHNAVLVSYPHIHIKLSSFFLSERFFFSLQPKHASAYGDSGGSCDGDVWL